MRLIVANRLLEFGNAEIAIRLLRRHRLERDVDQLARHLRRHDHVVRGRHQAFHHRRARMRSMAGDDLVEDGPEEIDVARFVDLLHRPHGHFGRHVGGRSAHGHLAGRRVQRQGESPVHHQHFAELADHHVFGLEIAMHDAARMGEGDAVGHLQQDLDVFRLRFLRKKLVPGRAFDMLHRVEDRACFVAAQIVNRNDVGVFQIARNDRLGQKFFPLDSLPRPAASLEHFERDGTANGRLLGGVHHAHAAFPQLSRQLVVADAHAPPADRSRRELSRLNDQQPLETLSSRHFVREGTAIANSSRTTTRRRTALADNS